MISNKEKKQLILKTLSIILITLIILSVGRVIALNDASLDTIHIYTLVIQEFYFATISAVFVVSILYLFTNKELHKVKKKANNYAFTDALTGLYNRHYLNNFLEKFTALRKDDANFAVLFIDIDKFKLVNDTLGHVTGDCILKILASKLKLLTRSKDILCRYGGEEFVMILSDISKENALDKANHLREAIQNMLFDCEQQSITISIGLSFGTINTDINQIMIEADKALYVAKDAGRNCVKVFNSEYEN